MPRAEAGSIKAVANGLKARGLTKLRFYCQICSKACRDQNGYNNHIESEGHIRQMQVIGGKGGGKVIDDFSRDFKREFVRLLSRRFGTKKVKANQVYQEYIADRHHVHMNATRWLSLAGFVKHLAREGIARIEETEQGWYISWIDNSPDTLARQDALQKLERSKMDDEQRQRKYLKEQIERAEKEKVESGENDGPKLEEGLKREGSAPLKIGISLVSAKKPESGTEGEESKPSTTLPATEAGSSSAASTPAAPAFKFGMNPLKSTSKPTPSLDFSTPTNPLKAVSSSSSKDSAEEKKSKPPSSMTMAEKIMVEEMERKKRKAEGGRGPGPMMQQNIKRSRF